MECKGKEAYSILCEDGTWSSLKVIIDEKYHLSFPNIFEYGGKMYIMPEMSEDYSLKLYEAVSFPDEWKLLKIFYLMSMLVTLSLLKRGCSISSNQ